MDTSILIGTITVTAALLSYSVAIITEQIKKKATKIVLIFLTSGIILDIIATSCMIYGSDNSAFTLHGFVGYSADDLIKNGIHLAQSTTVCCG